MLVSHCASTPKSNLVSPVATPEEFDTQPSGCQTLEETLGEITDVNLQLCRDNLVLKFGQKPQPSTSYMTEAFTQTAPQDTKDDSNHLLDALQQVEKLRDQLMAAKAHHQATLTELVRRKEEAAKVMGDKLVLYEKLDKMSYMLTQQQSEKAVLLRDLANLRGNMEILEESISPPPYHDICVDSSCTDSHSGPSSSCIHQQEQPEATKQVGPKHTPKKPKATKLLIGTSILRDV